MGIFFSLQIPSHNEAQSDEIPNGGIQTVVDVVNEWPRKVGINCEELEGSSSHAKSGFVFHVASLEPS